jgi:hypothetical protein
MDAELRGRIENNLFPAARPAIEEWDEFRWHLYGKNCDSDKKHSSQALAIDVFGTIKMATPAERAAIFGQLCVRLRLPTGGDWQVDLEWEDEENRLKERRKSQIDAIAKADSAWILFECKFGEVDGGACSQTRPVRRGARSVKQCDGNYKLQINPLKKEAGEHRCALTAKGVRYWDSIPRVFKLESGRDYIPCPFDSPRYQWMRNLVLAEEIRRAKRVQTGFVILYADHPNLPFSRRLSGSDGQLHKDWNRFISSLRAEAPPLLTISYAELLTMVVQLLGEKDKKWSDLQSWVTAKIRDVGDYRRSTRIPGPSCPGAPD